VNAVIIRVHKESQGINNFDILQVLRIEHRSRSRARLWRANRKVTGPRRNPRRLSFFTHARSSSPR
jgi:hypothetical protein